VDAADKATLMSDAAPQPESRPAPPFPGLAAVGAAFRALTVLGGGPAARVDASALYYPLVGLALGAVWVLTDRATSALAGRMVASLAVILVATAATGARAVRALARTLAALVSGRECSLEVLEHGAGWLPALALAGVLGGEIAVLYSLDRFRLVGLAFAPVLGCCSMVVIAVGSRAARRDGRRLKFAPGITFREFGLASTATFALIFLSADFLGLLLVLTTAACTIGARVFFHRWIDGVNETAMLATGEAVQLVILALLAAFS